MLSLSRAALEPILKGYERVKFFFRILFGDFTHTMMEYIIPELQGKTEGFGHILCSYQAKNGIVTLRTL
jgi:hypothetical protein